MKKLIAAMLVLAFVTTIVGCRAEAEVGDTQTSFPTP